MRDGSETIALNAAQMWRGLDQGDVGGLVQAGHLPHRAQHVGRVAVRRLAQLQAQDRPDHGHVVLHAVIDLVQTGSTLRANHLEELDVLFESSARLIVNRAALKLRRERLRPLIAALRELTSQVAEERA